MKNVTVNRVTITGDSDSIIEMLKDICCYEGNSEGGLNLDLDKDVIQMSSVIPNFEEIIPTPKDLLMMEEGNIIGKALMSYLNAICPIPDYKCPVGGRYYGIKRVAEWKYKEMLVKVIYAIKAFNFTNINNLDMSEEMVKLGRTYFHNIDIYGYPTWLGWRKNNWDTDFPAFAGNLEKISPTCYVLTFGTNCPPYSIIKKLAELYTDLCIEYESVMTGNIPIYNASKYARGIKYMCLSSLVDHEESTKLIENILNTPEAEKIINYEFPSYNCSDE